MVENAAECRSDIIGNIVKWKTEHWIANEVRNDAQCKITPVLSFRSRWRRGRCSSCAEKSAEITRNISSSRRFSTTGSINRGVSTWGAPWWCPALTRSTTAIWTSRRAWWTRRHTRSACTPLGLSSCGPASLTSTRSRSGSIPTPRRRSTPTSGEQSLQLKMFSTNEYYKDAGKSERGSERELC